MEGLVEECECQKRWTKLAQMGSGANGSAYLACKVPNSKDCEYVIKEQQDNDTARREFDAYMRLKRHPSVPKLHAAWLCNGKMYLVIDKLKQCPKKRVKDKLEGVLDRLRRSGWLHVDVHEGNIMCNKQGLKMIDLGWAVNKNDAPYRNHPTGVKRFDHLEIIQKLNMRRVVNNLNNL